MGASGLAAIGDNHAGLHVLDPDGFPIQIQTNDRR
jgi:hypothetical protein